MLSVAKDPQLVRWRQETDPSSCLLRMTLCLNCKLRDAAVSGPPGSTNRNRPISSPLFQHSHPSKRSPRSLCSLAAPTSSRCRRSDAARTLRRFPSPDNWWSRAARRSRHRWCVRADARWRTAKVARLIRARGRDQGREGRVLPEQRDVRRIDLDASDIRFGVHLVHEAGESANVGANIDDTPHRKAPRPKLADAITIPLIDFPNDCGSWSPYSGRT